MSSPAARLLLGLIALWRRWLSPAWPSICRYQPSCSAYAREAVERHGALRGGGLAILRLLRCAPWGGRGWDPVPSVPLRAGRA